MSRPFPKRVSVETVIQGQPNMKPPKAGDHVLVHYTGRLKDGTVFDSSVDRGQPFSFQLGTGKVIRGWDVGVERMGLGEKAMLYIPADQAYGERRTGPIPPNSDLIFEIQLLRVVDCDIRFFPNGRAWRWDKKQSAFLQPSEAAVEAAREEQTIFSEAALMDSSDDDDDGGGGKDRAVKIGKDHQADIPPLRPKGKPAARAAPQPAPRPTSQPAAKPTAAPAPVPAQPAPAPAPTQSTTSAAVPQYQVLDNGEGVITVRIELPGLTHIRDFEVDVHVDSVTVRRGADAAAAAAGGAVGAFVLQIALGAAVDRGRAVAKFSKKKAQLSITAPTIR
jgi:peptidylprolyl isomerase